MKKILITYNLNEWLLYAKRQRLEKAIEGTFKTRWRRLTTTWIVETAWTAAEVGRWVSQHLDAKDELFVVDITGQAAAWQGFDPQGSEWLKDVLKR